MILKSIINKINRFILMSGALVLALGSLQSCKDDVLDPDGSSGGGDSESAYYLSFSVGLQSMGNGTRAGSSEVEKYEDHVDEDKLYIMFFLTDKDGEDKLFKMFRPGDKAVSMIPVAYNSSTLYNKSWYIRISIPDLDPEWQDVFVSTLKEKDFRVAVMANAEKSKSIVMSEAEISNGEIEELGSNINDLHRQTSPDKYFDKENKTAVYGFLKDLPDGVTGNGRDLGYHSNWVKNKSPDFDKETAEKFIRENLKPGKTGYRDYEDLWSLWNFGGGADDNALPYEYFSNSWKKANGNFLTTKMNEALSYDTDKLFAFSTGDERVAEDEVPEKVYLEYIDFSLDEEYAYAKAVKNASGSQFYYGVQLPKNRNGAGSNGSNYVRFNPIDGGCLSFTATGSGKLRITGRSPEEGKTVKVIAQVAKKDTKLEFTFDNNVTESEAQSFTINSDSQIIYIYTDSYSEAEAAEIFQIEYVQDTYLYETDREGVAPTLDNPIPMYGVAQYEAIGDRWREGNSFDLDNYSGTSPEDKENGFVTPTPPATTYFHPIPLLRSVAKVIVRVPKKFGANHVYLRSVNRQARWEPADVKTNTIDLWNDGTEDFQNQHSPTCEFFNIMGQVPFYEPSSTKDNSAQLRSYQEKLAWYYGTWMEQGVIKERYKVPGGPYQSPNNTDFHYPRIMNALVERSDFVQFLYAGTEEIYDRFVLYVGEKYVDDPNKIDDSNGIENSIPKVCHVEFRIDGDHYDNLDDNQCYRIYFTDNGFNKNMKMPDLRDDEHSWEKMYEQDVDNLKAHWPIIRNHVYRFTVEDINSQIVIVNLEVLPWKKVNDIEVSW